jgi:CspA family cold shock protein
MQENGIGFKCVSAPAPRTQRHGTDESDDQTTTQDAESADSDEEGKLETDCVQRIMTMESWEKPCYWSPLTKRDIIEQESVESDTQNAIVERTSQVEDVEQVQKLAPPGTFSPSAGCPGVIMVPCQSMQNASVGGKRKDTGTLNNCMADQGYAFITPDNGGDDIFAHVHQFIGSDPNKVQKGDRVTYECQWDDKGKCKATKWSLLEPVQGYVDNHWLPVMTPGFHSVVFNPHDRCPLPIMHPHQIPCEILPPPPPVQPAPLTIVDNQKPPSLPVPMPQPQGLSRAYSTSSSGIFRVSWAVSSTKLQQKDHDAVSPPFQFEMNGRQIDFKLRIFPNAAKGGFRNSNGVGRIELKCEGSFQQDEEAWANYRFFVSSGNAQDTAKNQKSRGPVRHDFAKRPSSSLPPGEDQWNFKASVDQKAKIFLIVCEFLPDQGIR